MHDTDGRAPTDNRERLLDAAKDELINAKVYTAFLVETVDFNRWSNQEQCQGCKACGAAEKRRNVR